MTGLQSPDGSYNVTVNGGPMQVTPDDGHGLYAPDGSYRVTVVGATGGSALVSNGQEVTLSGTTYTFTVEDGAITAITTG